MPPMSSMSCWNMGSFTQSFPVFAANRYHSFEVVTTVRSEEKGRRILDAHPNTPKEKLSYVIVEDIAKEGAFDEVSLSEAI